VKPCCFDCLSEEVTVKVIDRFGCEYWFCAADWAAEQAFHEQLMKWLAERTAALAADP